MALELISLVTSETFYPTGYIYHNTDVAKAFGFCDEAAIEHYNSSGKDEIRYQINPELVKERSIKNKKLINILDTERNYQINEFGAYDFLTPEMREQFKITDTSNISSNEYLYEGHEQDQSCLILDCGSGYRKTYYQNVIYFDIVGYPSTDVMGVGEDLPFKDNSFDYVKSFSVFEHVLNPQKCADEICRVLKPGGVLYFDVPFMAPYHDYPAHYFNFTSQGVKVLFEDKCDVLSHSVPLFWHPIYALTWFATIWASGLSGNALDEFKNLQIKDLIDRIQDPQFYEYQFVKDLPSDVQEKIATGTRLVARKR